MEITSNGHWFLSYLWLRHLIIFLFAIKILSFLPFFKDYLLLSQAFYNIISLLLLFLLVIEYIEKPSILEVYQEDDGLLIKQFVPDTRYFFRFSEQKMQCLKVDKQTQVSLVEQKEYFGIVRKVFLMIGKIDGEILKTHTTSLGWRHQQSVEKLKLAIAQHNAKVRKI